MRCLRLREGKQHVDVCVKVTQPVDVTPKSSFQSSRREAWETDRPGVQGQRKKAMPNTTPLFSFCCQGYNSGPLCPPFAGRPGGGSLHFVLEARPGKGHCAHLSSFTFLSLLLPFLPFLSFLKLRFKIYKLGLPW